MRWIATMLLFLSMIILAEGVDKVFVAVVGKGEEVAALEKRLSGIVSGFLSKSDKKVFLENLKDCQMGISKCAAFDKFPFVDFAIYVGNPVKIYSFERNLVDVLPGYISKDVDAVADYFEQFTLYYHLPRFEDPQAKKGDVYILMNENFEDIGKCVIEKRTNIVDLSRCIKRGAAYARKQRRVVKFRDYEKEIRKSDIAKIWVGAKRFEVYKDGQLVKIPVKVNVGGYLIIVDVYNGEAVVISSKPVESGNISYEFQAYHDPDVKVEELVFALIEPSERLGNFSVGKYLNEKDFKDLIESAVGIGVFRFTVLGEN